MVWLYEACPWLKSLLHGLSQGFSESDSKKFRPLDMAVGEFFEFMGICTSYI